jgi:hypothetical protein
MDGDKVYGLCSLCGGALLSDHDCIGLRKAFGLPPTVDWRAVARDAAVRIAAALWVEDDTAFSGSPEQVEAQRERYAQNIRSIAFREALALVAEMRKRAEFGGQP